MSIQSRVDDFLLGVDAAPGGPGRFAAARPRAPFFSPFVDEHLLQATDLATDLGRLADAPQGFAKDGDRLDAVLAEAQRAAADIGPAAARYALRLFITHHPSARALRVPSTLRQVVPAALAEEGEQLPPLGGATTSADEDKINWFREDPLANDHHEHWHLVYPRLGLPPGRTALQERHGELFFYMHEQMLARYDCERLAAGLAPVSPFEDFRAPIADGYDPGDLMLNGETLGIREADVPFRDLPPDALGQGSAPYAVTDHETRRDRLSSGVAARALKRADGSDVPLVGHQGSDILGATEETTRDTLSPATPVSPVSYLTYYGNHHGFGHVLCAFSGVEGAAAGVMAYPATAIRDPFFWRWHRHVDDLNFRLQEGEAPNNFADAPAIEFGGPAGDGSDGLALFYSEALPADANHAAILSALFASDGFNDHPGVGDAEVTHDGATHRFELLSELRTETRDGVYGVGGQRYTFPYLWHRPFSYALRLRNPSGEAQPVTVRLFLCPRETIEDRRQWIEMDKFAAVVGAGENAVLVRGDTESTVIRRPAVDPGDGEQIDALPDLGAVPESVRCECGWPYHLLLPKGTAAGMAFQLLAIVTDGRLDQLAAQGSCGSMSFCGAKERYPDRRPMGYPFDRPLVASIPDLAASTPSIVVRPITIRHAPF